MNGFDWIEEHQVIPDLNDNLSFDSVTLTVPRHLCVKEGNPISHVQWYDSIEHKIKISQLIQKKFYRGERVGVPFYLRMKLKVKENRNYIPDNVWDSMSQYQKDKLTTVKFYWNGLESLMCFELSIDNVKELYNKNQIRLTMLKNPIL
jgi:hypothetical protein